MTHITPANFSLENNQIDFAGYTANVDYAWYWELPCICQYIHDFGNGKQISYYNETEKDVEKESNKSYSCLVAVWRKK